MDKVTGQVERNGRVQDRYDELMHEGKHGHYETLFRVVNEEIERDRQATLNARPADDIMRTIQNVPVFNMNGYGDDDVRRLHDWAVSVVHLAAINAQQEQPPGERK